MNTQTLVENIEQFCDELVRLKQLYSTIIDFTSRPLSKEDVRKFINSGFKGAFEREIGVVRLLPYLTVKPSEYNAARLQSLLCSNRNDFPRRQCALLSAKAKQLSKSMLTLIKIKIDEAGDDQNKIAGLKRCILIFPLIFKAERDVVIPQESLCELTFCEERLYEDTDTLLRCAKDMLDEKFQHLFLNDLATGCCAGLNDKNWCSVNSLIAQVLSISEE